MKEFYDKVHEIIGKDEFPLNACNAITIHDDSVMIHFDAQKVDRQMISELFNVKNWEIERNIDRGYDYLVADGEINGISFDVFLTNIKIS
ncbi:MAG: hypothetical protein K9J21_07180 [Bacteroidales bacterium]|nr:hypothetical protein [Bacteroidales bacterium]